MPKLVELTVAEELKKNPSIKQQDIDSLREWVTKQPHLPHVSGSVTHFYARRLQKLISRLDFRFYANIILA